MTNAQKLLRAAHLIQAVKVSPRRWAHYATETDRWYTVSAKGLRALIDYLDDPATCDDAYSHWCADVDAREMPEGWAP